MSATKAPKMPAANRAGVPKTFWIDEELDAALTAYLDGRNVKTQQTAAFIAALKMFLASEGYWPPKKSKE